MAKVRLSQLAQEYRKEIADIISYHTKDDAITGLVSVLSADVSPDLKHAHVYISIFQPDEEKKAACFAAIERNAGHIRHELARRMTQRTVPELHFVMDTSMDYSEKINRILQDIGPIPPAEEDKNKED